MREGKSKHSNPRVPSLRWMEMLWEATNTSTQEERRKEEVLALFRGLANDSKSNQEIREYMRWRPQW
jgi:hypothetical protein